MYIVAKDDMMTKESALDAAPWHDLAKYTDASSIRAASASSVGGVPTRAFAIVDATSLFSRVVIVVGRADGLPRRMVRQGPLGTETVLYSRFNVPVTIAPPR